ncbi:hypothetical protein BCON_0317g00150 [Botryotinia convoluta]|uniref:Uncharacterized protein n=1 Tax=Botryotinia convoluta TaxID=54673 RepID=A0A4Z1HCJ6_9HELO|nr:hypothetical protein BCON_0317g00150 [Botryotinia convoluta]
MGSKSCFPHGMKGGFLLFGSRRHYYFPNKDNSQTYGNGHGWLFCINPSGERRWKAENEDEALLEQRVLYGAGNGNIIYAEGFVEGETVDGYDHKLNRILIYDYTLEKAKEKLSKAQQAVDKLQNDEWEDPYLNFLNTELDMVPDCEVGKNYVSGVRIKIEKVEQEKEERPKKDIKAEVWNEDEITIKVEEQQRLNVELALKWL